MKKLFYFLITIIIFLGQFLLFKTEIAQGVNYSRTFATYIGGQEWENIRGMTTDSQGNIYITGGTNSADYPRTFGPTNQSGTPSICISIACSEIFVTKFSPDGQTVLWSRLIGTTGHDRAYGIKYHEVGGVGYLLLYGRMGKNYTMTPGVFQTQFQGPDFPNSGYGWQNGFVAKLNPSTGDIIWISYVGTETLVRNADVDELGNVYIITGYRSPLFSEPSPCAPHTTGCVPWYDKFVGRAYPTPPGGTTDLVLLKVSHDGSTVYWATYFGGPGSEDAAGGIAVNKITKEFYIMGQSTSAGLATPGIFSQGASLHGGKDFLIAKFNSSATSRLWAGYVGGSAEEPYGCKNILLDSAGNVVIAAPSTSSDLPTTPGAFQRTPGGGSGNSFVAKITADGTTYAATFLAGNSAMSNVEGFDINSRGEIVVGFELSGTTNFPVTSDALQSNYPGTKNGAVAVLSNDLSQLIYSTLYGGGGDGFRALVVDSNDNIIAAGHSESGNFPTYNAYDSTRNISTTHYWPGGGGDDWDGIMLKLSYSSAGDTQAPTIPNNLSATPISSSQINLAWTASTDNVGVTGYRIFRGGTQVGTSASNSYSDIGLSPSTSYTYTVSAYDAAGNVSGQSASASAATQPFGGATTIRFYAGSGDGDVFYYANPSAWDTIHNAAAGSNTDYTSVYTSIQVWVSGTGSVQIDRTFMPIDTSALPDNSSIISATLYLYINQINDADNDGDDYLNIVQATPASNNSLTTSDYSRCGATHTSTTGAAAVDISNISTSAYTPFVLNSTGLSWINKTGITNFGIREGHDLKDSPVAGWNFTRAYTSEQAGIAQDPYLEVTYATGGDTIPPAAPSGVAVS